jgi:hypothetical protein
MFHLPEKYRIKLPKTHLWGDIPETTTSTREIEK